MAEHNDTGNKAEAMAAKMLAQKGYKIIEQNYTFGKGEIDLIIEKDTWLIFVEVRARSDISYGFPEETISKAKQNLLKKTAENYIFTKNWQGKIRFDIVSILVGNQFEITHFEDAFY